MGHAVFVFAHSHVGVVCGAAAAGLSKVERVREGKKGSRVGLVYLAGNIDGEKSTLLEGCVSRLY